MPGCGSPVAKTSRPTFSARTAISTFAPIRSASVGVGSPVTSPTLKTPNCIVPACLGPRPGELIVDRSTSQATTEEGSIFLPREPSDGTAGTLGHDT